MISVSMPRPRRMASRSDAPCTNALNRVLRTVRVARKTLRSGYSAWPKSPGVKACRMRGLQWSSAKLPSQTDQDCSLSGVAESWEQDKTDMSKWIFHLRHGVKFYK